MTNVRYIVDDVDAAVAFYTEHLDFEVEMHAPAGFAMLDREDLGCCSTARGRRCGAVGRRGPGAGTGRVDPLPARRRRPRRVLRRLSESGVRFGTSPVEGGGGRQAVVEDPSRNPIELFEPPER